MKISAALLSLSTVVLFATVTAVGCSDGRGNKPSGVSVGNMNPGTSNGPGPDMAKPQSDATCGGFIPSGLGTTCDSCISGGSCCAAGTACGSNADCTDLLNCIGSCAANDTACVQSCASGSPGGVSDLQAFQQCIQSECSAECSDTSGGGGGGGGGGGMCGDLATGVAACDTCLDTNCCSQNMACSGSMACLGYLDCLSTMNCTTTACADGCSASNPGGASLLNALDSCMSSKCSTQCM
jgi:hypothetical protein